MILDRSGSMADRQDDVIGGFNSFIKTCRDRLVERCDVQFARFDEEIEPCVFRLSLADVPAMTAARYAPRGGTALLDAVGQTVSPVATNADDRYIVIVFTDGEENSSREWTKEKVAALIQEREALGNWTFAFFGAEIDAWDEGGGMGFAAGNTRAHSRADYAFAMASTATMTSIMARKGMRSSRQFARATMEGLEKDLDDDALEQILREEDDAATPAPQP